ncbi:hypothetical protein EON83_12200 [bacterium]|nr:MAG: hypothetical protein EON83_12200 [bacterium]
MSHSVFRSVLMAVIYGLVAVVVSLPVLFWAHSSLGLGNPPVTGLLLLGGTVVISFALAGAIGASMGRARGNAFVAALLGLIVGGAACFIVAPFYGGLVVEGVSRDATGLVLSERGRIEDAVRGAATTRGKEAFDSAREGRLQEQLSDYQKQAKEATTPQARSLAAQRARELATQLASQGKTKGVALIKSGAARTSAFALLLWALVGPPFVAALSCRQAKR